MKIIILTLIMFTPVQLRLLFLEIFGLLVKHRYNYLVVSNNRRKWKNFRNPSHFILTTSIIPRRPWIREQVAFNLKTLNKFFDTHFHTRLLCTRQQNYELVIGQRKITPSLLLKWTSKISIQRTRSREISPTPFSNPFPHSPQQNPQNDILGRLASNTFSSIDFEPIVSLERIVRSRKFVN